MPQITDPTDGREEHSERVQLLLALGDLEAVDWKTGVPGQAYHLVKLNKGADMDDVLQLHRVAKEFDRAVSLRRESEYTSSTVWRLEERD